MKNNNTSNASVPNNDNNADGANNSNIESNGTPQNTQTGDQDKAKDNYSSRSFFGTLNHPEKYLDVPEDATPQEIADFALDLLIDGHEDERAAMVSYCLAPTTGTPHLHYGLYSKKSMRLNAVRALMPHADNKPAKGTKDQIEDYVRKTGKHAEKGEEVLAVATFGEFKGAEANQSVFDQMYDYIWKLHLTPVQVCRMEPKMYSHINTLRQMYADCQAANLPPVKELHTVYHVGAPGSGKSYVQVELKDSLPENSVYVVTDYVHGFDLYQNQPTIFLDELKDQVRFADLLMWLDVYPNQIACRYANQYMTWTTVHIASVIPPEELIQHLPGIKSEPGISWGELKRRIHEVCFHWTYKGHFYAASIPMSNYIEGLWTPRNVENFLPCAVLAAAGCDNTAITNLVLDICTDEWLAKRVDINTNVWTEEADATWERLVDSYYMLDVGRHLTEQIAEALFQGSFVLTASLLTVQLTRTAARSSELIPLTGELSAIQGGFKDRHTKLDQIEAALLLKAFDQWSEFFSGMSMEEQKAACQEMLAGIVKTANCETDPDVLDVLEASFMDAKIREALCEDLDILEVFFLLQSQAEDQPGWLPVLLGLMQEYRILLWEGKESPSNEAVMHCIARGYKSVPFNSSVFLGGVIADAFNKHLAETSEVISHEE